MNKQTGIWIDTKQAIIVYLEKDGQKVKKIHSERVMASYCPISKKKNNYE